MKFFILGILFVSVFSPILDSLTGLTVQAIQFLTANIAVKAYGLKKQIEDLEEKNEEETEKHYGFYSLPDPQPFSEDDQEEEDKADDE